MQRDARYFAGGSPHPPNTSILRLKFNLNSAYLKQRHRLRNIAEYGIFNLVRAQNLLKKTNKETNFSFLGKFCVRAE